ncbi:MAG: hypothetical protein EA367_14720 [Leptolyngbya sp. DLM2.Bin15]|nr:MAG: hypothetical protein EA367_14720 [Leptolyngbya sp. DLM2.Bin15]
MEGRAHRGFGLEHHRVGFLETNSVSIEISRHRSLITLDLVWGLKFHNVRINRRSPVTFAGYWETSFAMLRSGQVVHLAA